MRHGSMQSHHSSCNPQLGLMRLMCEGVGGWPCLTPAEASGTTARGFDLMAVTCGTRRDVSDPFRVHFRRYQIGVNACHRTLKALVIGVSVVPVLRRSRHRAVVSAASLPRRPPSPASPPP